jgi:uncharacterized protein
MPETVFDRAGARTYDTRPMLRPPAELDAPATLFVVDATVLAHGGLSWERDFSETHFARLGDVAVSDQPAVSIKLKFAMFEQRPVIHGELQVAVELICQRCMAAMLYPLRETFELMVIESEDELGLVPESYEPWITNAARLDVLALVEEQLLLALPLIAKHADERDCVQVESISAVLQQSGESDAHGTARAVANKEVQRPFGNLRDLLVKD